MNYKSILSKIFIIFGIVIFVLPESISAIPAFAREHKVSCTTCHSVFPRLKDYGDEFAGNGFIMKEAVNNRNFVKSGDDRLLLNKTFPLAVRMEAFGSYDESKDVEYDLQSPWGIKLLSGGTLYKDIGYYFYFYMYERGEVAGIEDAYIHFDNVFDSNLDIMVGQFQTSDPLMKRELRLTYEDYMIYKTRIGLSSIDLAYDRGVLFAYGLEQTSTDIVVMVTNGNGKPEAEDRRLDTDNYKNLGLRVNQSLNDIISVGGYYYLGSEKYSENNQINDVTYYGADFSVRLENIELTAQYLNRNDSNPVFGNTYKDVNTDGYIAELVYSPDMNNSKYYITSLYNNIDSDLYKYQTATLSYTYLVARNLRLVGEYTYDLENEHNRFILGVIGAF
ncbi:hypothetical protein ACFL4B_00275 [Candidatus Neomarinimicrobiota bacterium]